MIYPQVGNAHPTRVTRDASKSGARLWAQRRAPLRFLFIKLGVPSYYFLCNLQGDFSSG
jgi:hypothetical protein